MNPSITIEQRIARVTDYFRKGDAGDLALLDMFSADIELYFPKFGTRVGKAAVVAFLSEDSWARSKIFAMTRTATLTSRRATSSSRAGKVA